jgi:DNA-3-methyladenine glycosylase II
MRRIHDLAGDPPLRRSAAGFPGLLRIVVGQQVSTASAAAIWTRLSGVLGEVSAARVSALDDTTLLSAGLSRPKLRTIRSVSAAVLDGTMDFERLATEHEEHARQALTAVTGIGPWTADLYLMFCVGRPDIFAPGDLALQIAAQSALGLQDRPSGLELAAIAERWRPWRAVAARMLWAYYAWEKNQRAASPM